MDSFETIRDTLFRHLPRPATGTSFEVDADGLRITPPGIGVADIAALLGELTGNDEILPADFVPAGLRIETLSLTRSERNRGADFSFDLVWDSGGLDLGDGFPLEMARISLEKRATRLVGFAEAKLTLDNLKLDVTLELPSQVVTGDLKDGAEDEGVRFLAGRGLLDPAKGARLRSLTVSAAIPLRYLSLHVELEHLFRAGPISLTEVVADLSLSESLSDASPEASARFQIDLPGEAPLLIAIEGEIDAEGWRLAGDLHTDGGGLRFDKLAGALVNALSPSAAKALSDLPHVINNAMLTHIAAAIDTHDDSVSFDCTLDWAHDAELVVHLELRGGELEVSGTLAMNGFTFRLIFEKGGGQVLIGVFEAAGHAAITLDDVLAALSSNGQTAFGPNGTGIEIGIKSLALALDDGGRALLASEIDAGIDLSRLGELPLVGSLLPKDEPLGLAITPFYMAQGFAAAPLVRPLLPSNLTLPDPLVEGPHFAATLHLGGKPITLDDVDLGTTPEKAQPPELPPGGKPVAAAAPLSAGTEIKWEQIDKVLGPLHIGRVGYALDTSGPALDLALDASLGLGGLTLSLQGFGAHYNFTTRALSPRLEGLGVDVKSGPVEIGGAFLNIDGDFAGEVVIGTPQFSLSALGAFKMIDGTPSMFVYGVLDMPLGGPVFFFVDGLTVGFGLHRQLKPPKIEDVHRFPLVASAVAAALGEEMEKDPVKQLTRLHDYITPKLAHHFLAAGIKFNSFKLLNGFVVVIASFGDRLAVDLIGTADFASPPDLPRDVPALAKIELDIVARFLPDEGRLAVDARVNPSSYVYGPLCHLSGGFAFYAWMKGGRAGDFVLSLGGYHPDFRPPPDYPRVPRLELKYQVTPDVYLKGSAYFAMTPAVMMAGGGLHAQVNIGALSAWADLSVDFIVYWEPFHYDSRVHLEIGAKWKCFHTTATADLYIWGPKFSGTASVDWFIFSFDVEFGPHTPALPLPISVAKFKSSFLQIDDKPKSANDILGIVALGGVITEIDGRPLVTPVELKIGLSTRVPVTRAVVGHRDDSLSLKLGVAPAGFPTLGESKVTIKISAVDGGADVTGRFAIAYKETGVPPALWGTSMRVDKNAPMIPAITGLELTTSERPTQGDSHEVLAKDLWEANSVTLHAQSAMGFGHMGPMPTELPRDDLSALGLDPSALVFVPPPATQTLA